MRLDDYRESSNIEKRRGAGGLPAGRRAIGGRGLGFGGLVVVVVLALLLGVNPLALLGDPGEVASQSESIDAPVQPQTGIDRFVARVLATTEDSWSRIFAAQGAQYPQPRLVLYAATSRSGCGIAQAAAGPFYCPSDQRIYLDTSFFDELARRFGAPGDFAAAYVIAHEVGHHVQNVTGTLERARKLQSPAPSANANAIQVRIELQADCYAGVWARANRTLLEPGDIEEAMRAAAAVGDDMLQRRAQGHVVPDSFTHGTSEQRTRWFMAGFESGDPSACDTFATQRL